jgi:hypothetical protein
MGEAGNARASVLWIRMLGHSTIAVSNESTALRE